MPAPTGSAERDAFRPTANHSHSRHPQTSSTPPGSTTATGRRTQTSAHLARAATPPPVTGRERERHLEGGTLTLPGSQAVQVEHTKRSRARTYVGARELARRARARPAKRAPPLSTASVG